MEKTTDELLVGALHNAGNDLEDLFRRVIRIIDSRYGEGYAEKHPELIGALVQSTTNQAVGYLQTIEIKEVIDNISSAMINGMHLTLEKEE